MKVMYRLKGTVDIKVIKEELKQFGGRCAKVVEKGLEYQVKEENEAGAHEFLMKQGYVE